MFSISHELTSFYYVAANQALALFCFIIFFSTILSRLFAEVWLTFSRGNREIHNIVVAASVLRLVNPHVLFLVL